MRTASANRFCIRRKTTAGRQISRCVVGSTLVVRRHPLRRRYKTPLHSNAHSYCAYPCGVHNVPVADQNLSLR